MSLLSPANFKNAYHGQSCVHVNCFRIIFIYDLPESRFGHPCYTVHHCAHAPCGMSSSKRSSWRSRVFWKATPSLYCLALKTDKLSCSETSANYSPFDTASHSTRPVSSSCPTMRTLVQVSVCNHLASYVSGVEPILGSRWPWGINCVQQRITLWESSVWNFANVTLRALRNFKWLLHYWKICVPLCHSFVLSLRTWTCLSKTTEKNILRIICALKLVPPLHMSYILIISVLFFS